MKSNKKPQSGSPARRIAVYHKQERGLYSSVMKGGEPMQISWGGFAKPFEGFVIRARAII